MSGGMPVQMGGGRGGYGGGGRNGGRGGQQQQQQQQQQQLYYSTHSVRGGGGGGMQPAPAALADKQLVCRECQAQFVWTVGQQRYYREKGLEYAPGRCPPCNSKKRVRPLAPTTHTHARARIDDVVLLSWALLLA